MPWAWDDTQKIHINTDDGSRMTREKLLAFSQQSVEASVSQINTLASQISTGILTPAQWREGMREELKHEYIRQYLLGRGGRDQMTSVDWGSIGGSLVEQYKYLDGFADVVGGLTEGQIKVRTFVDLVALARLGDGRSAGWVELSNGYSVALGSLVGNGRLASGVQRAAMYVNSAREAFYRARARALGFSPDQLPYQPADGGTACLTRCNCDWEYVPVQEDDQLIGWDCYWRLGASEKHCADCLIRANESAPFRIRF